MRRMFVLLAVGLLAACATVQPGQDATTVHTQQTLAIGQNVYDWGMAWCQTNAGTFSPAGLTLVNKIRVDFPPAYRALDTALDSYKAGKAGDLQGALDKFTSLFEQLQALVTSAGGPDFKAQAVAKAGGAS